MSGRGAVGHLHLFVELWAVAHVIEVIIWRLHLRVDQAGVPLILAFVAHNICFTSLF